MKVVVNDPANTPSLDISEVTQQIELLIANDGRSVWLNIDGVCVARVSRVDSFVRISSGQDGFVKANYGRIKSS